MTLVIVFIFHCRTEDFLLPLTDANNEDLIKKNKKKKTLGSIHLKVTMSPITKEEMNEVCNFDYYPKDSLWYYSQIIWRNKVLRHHFYLPKVIIQVQTGLEFSAG